MSAYTPDEVQAVVERLVLSTIRRPYDTLGVRRTDLSFGDVQQAAAGVFILYPNSPFYVLWLGTQRLNDRLTNEAAIIESLLDALEATGLNVLPVEDVSPLFNAQAALQELGTAAGGRAGVFTDITKAPAFQRYSANVDQFLTGPGQNVKNKGAIVMTPQQARAAIPGLMTQLQDAHEALLAAVAGIAGGIEDYNHVNLPAVVSSSVLNNAAALVGADAAALDVLTPTQRLALIRQTVLNILATRAVVTTFGSFSGPSDFYSLEGLGTPFSDATREAAPAEAVGTKTGAMAIIPGFSDELTLAMDGGTPFTIVLAGSVMATLNGQAEDSTFIIGDGVSPSGAGYTVLNNNKLRIGVDGVFYLATLTTSTTVTTPRTADEVAADIQAVLPAGVVAEGYYAPLRFHGTVDIPAGVSTTWTLPVPGSSDFIALGVDPTTDSVTVLSGPNAGTYLVTDVTNDSIMVAGTTVLQAGALIEVGPLHRRVRIRCNDPVPQLAVETVLTVAGNDPVTKDCALTLGLFNGLSSRCTRTIPSLVASDINTKSQQVEASSVLVNALQSVPARTEVLNAKRVTVSRARAVGNVVCTGLTAVLTVTSLTLAGTVEVGDVLVLRSGLNPGFYFSVDTINGLTPVGTQQLAVGDILSSTGPMAGTSDLGVACELGPAAVVNKYDVVTVEAGPNAGTYAVESQGLTPLDVLLQGILPLPVSKNLPLDMVVSIGGSLLSLKSKIKNTQSQILITGSAAELFFQLSTTTAYGTTPWFHLPASPRGLQAGDVLETYLSDYKNPSASYVLQGVAGRVIELSPNIPSNVSWQFTVQPVPFARLRVGTMNDYTTVKSSLDSWLIRSVNQPAFFTNFNRLVNPLLVNTNPTAVQVGSATNELRLLYSYLLAAQSATPATALDAILSTFTVEAVAPVDTLLQTFAAKGSARASDLLLAGQFSEFFGLTADGASYAGAFQEAARAVAMGDLPVRRVNRKEAQSSQLIGQTVSPDFEFTAASVTEVLPGAQVDPPGNYGQPSGYGKK